jgi:hypothetical protein
MNRSIMQPDAIEIAGSASLYPTARGGRGLPGHRAVEAWATAAWSLSVEGRAFLEDLDGGGDQPELRQMVRIRLLELLIDVDTALAGWAPVEEGHQLALALEYGLGNLAVLDGPELITVFALDQATGDQAEDAGVRALWDRLCQEFPGELPNPLLASGQRQILQALRSWSKLCAAVGADAGFLEPLLKNA